MTNNSRDQIFARLHAVSGQISEHVPETVCMPIETLSQKEKLENLKNLMEAAVLVGKGPELLMSHLDSVGLSHPQESELPAKVKDLNTFPAEGIHLESQLNSIEKHYIETALKMARGNESKAARLLHINHHTFRYRRKKFLK